MLRMIRITWWHDLRDSLFAMAKPANWPRIAMAARAYEKSPPALCPMCGYHGKFEAFGVPARWRALCPQCYSLERHRLFALAPIKFSGKSILHFASERCVQDLILRQEPALYRPADIAPEIETDAIINIEEMDEPDRHYDFVICNHVLEHVDDRRALGEIFRVLKPGGTLIAMVPIIEGWSQTYEDPMITDPADRQMHFGRPDHIRYYGADFRDRLSAAGFEVSEFTALGGDCAKYALERGSKIFLARTSDDAPSGGASG